MTPKNSCGNGYKHEKWKLSYLHETNEWKQLINWLHKQKTKNDRSLRYWLSYAIECQVGSRSKGGHSKSTFARKEKLESELKF